MITARWRIDAAPLDGLEDFMVQVDERVAFVGERVRNLIEPQLMDELRAKPGKVKYPIQWTSEKQRRAFFATNGFGRGIPTVRSNKMVNGWILDTRAAKGRFTLVVRNPFDYAKYVVGAIDFRSRNNALKSKQKFHDNTGWQDAVDTVSFWFEAARELYQKEIVAALNRAVKSRRRNR